MEPYDNQGILNLAAALERLGGDRELLEEVAQLFLETAPKALAQLREAVAKHDAPAVASAAHSLKGSVSNFEAGPSCQAALRLERMGRSGELTGVEEAFAALETEMERLQPALVALVAKRG